MGAMYESRVVQHEQDIFDVYVAWFEKTPMPAPASVHHRVLGLQETSLKVWDELVVINQTSVFLGMRTVALVMQQNGLGSIVNSNEFASDLLPDRSLRQQAGGSRRYGALSHEVQQYIL